MLTDIWAHRYAEDPKLMDEVEDDDFNPDDVASIIGADGPGDWEDLE